jgi:hypothetical protein
MGLMRKSGCFIGAAAAAVAVLLPLSGCAPAPAQCGAVVFVANSDSGAREITATNTACSTARILAITGKAGPASFSRYPFSCTSRYVVPAGLAYTAYTCTASGGRLVTWKLT